MSSLRKEIPPYFGVPKDIENDEGKTTADKELEKNVKALTGKEMLNYACEEWIEKVKEFQGKVRWSKGNMEEPTEEIVDVDDVKDKSGVEVSELEYASWYRLTKEATPTSSWQYNNGNCYEGDKEHRLTNQ
ncbi:10850_t:CDS:2, partial [Gigaspora rosea]